MRLSVIVPFHRRLEQLSRCLVALRQAGERLGPACELIVAADGSPDDVTDVAAASGARLLNLPGPRGPAAARNAAAAEASGDVLVFVDSDVVVHADALDRIARVIAETDAAAVFGAYDDEPADHGFVSQAKNLAHAFVHSQSSANAVTFWAGLGAVRAGAFRQVGGFDERLVRTGTNGGRIGTVEDIDLGYRLTAAGHRIMLQPAIRGTHLKRWSATEALVSDIRDRGIPWTQLIHRYGQLRSDLNLAVRYRLCVVLAYGGLVALALASVTPWALAWAAAAFSAVGILDGPYLVFVARRREPWFAARTLPLRIVHHLASGYAFAAGTIAYLVPRLLRVPFPGALPVDEWRTGRVR